MVFAIHVAFLAMRYAVRPALLFDELKANIVGRELAVKVFDRVSKVLGNMLFWFRHDLDSMSNFLLVVKGYLPKSLLRI